MAKQAEIKCRREREREGGFRGFVSKKGQHNDSMARLLLLLLLLLILLAESYLLPVGNFLSDSTDLALPLTRPPTVPPPPSGTVATLCFFLSVLDADEGAEESLARLVGGLTDRAPPGCRLAEAVASVSLARAAAVAALAGMLELVVDAIMDAAIVAADDDGDALGR